MILADNSLLAAYVLERDVVSVDLIDQVVADRGLPDTQMEPPPATTKRSSKGVTTVKRRRD